MHSRKPLHPIRQERKNKGLGLAINQQLCQMMGGEITVASNFTKGTIFTVNFPAVVEVMLPTTDVSC